MTCAASKSLKIFYSILFESERLALFTGARLPELLPRVGPPQPLASNPEIRGGRPRNTCRRRGSVHSSKIRAASCFGQMHVCNLYHKKYFRPHEQHMASQMLASTRTNWNWVVTAEYMTQRAWVRMFRHNMLHAQQLQTDTW